MSSSHLRTIRLRELEQAAACFPATGRILEIGAGAGWQALELERRGYDVQAVDIAGSPYEQVCEFPVVEYDGLRLPFPDANFDVVFSSNVLEHVRGLGSFEAEIRRVLAPSGRAVHVLPTSSWRLCTTLVFPLHLFRRVLERALKPGEKRSGASSRAQARPEAPRGWRRVLRILTPARHGEDGNVLSELYYFSGRRWRRHFRSAGLHLTAEIPTHLAYTGYEILGAGVGLRVRRMASYLIGSACRIYVMQPVTRPPESAKKSS